MPTPHPHKHQADSANQRAQPPTRRQLAYLRSLAARAGQTFAYPRTREQASVEIRRLKEAQAGTRTERSIERREIADAIARGPEDAAAVRLGEVVGFGSTAAWKDRS
jgi:hypothetical protein